MTKNGGTTHRRKDSDKTSRGQRKVEFQGYVNWELTVGHKPAYERWLGEQPDIDNMIEQLCEDGYDVKIRWDSYNRCFAAQAYSRDKTSPNAGWCLSMRAGGWWEAVQRLLFVHYIAFEGTWVSEEEQGWNDPFG